MSHLARCLIVLSLLCGVAPWSLHARGDETKEGDAPSDAGPEQNEAKGKAAPSLDDLLGITKPKKVDAPNTRDESKADPSATDPADKRDGDDKALTEEQASDAFRQAAADMKRAGERLADRRDVGLDTQRLQRAVLDRLDQVIEAARQQQSPQQQQQKQSKAKKQDQGSQSNAQKQADAQAKAKAQQASKSNQASKGESNNSNAAAATRKGVLEGAPAAWGNLPPRVRDELMQGLGETFSSVYQRMTEAYYRRLAEEQEEAE